MPKKKHSRARQPHRRRLGPTPVRTHDDAQSQLLFQDLRRALRSSEPLDLLTLVSGLLEVTDPRSRDPFDRDEEKLGLAGLVESFIGTPYAETTAALTVARALMTDEVLAASISHELARRRHPMPAWLEELEQARLDPDTWFLTHVLGDGDDYLIGVTLPSGDPLSALVYVDHNLGTVVKDAFLVPQPLEDLALQVGSVLDDPDQSLVRTDAAQARAVIEAAIESGSRMYPPLTSDSWPMCRPLVEWMVRMMPPGGALPELREWTEEELAALAEEFFTSPYGVTLDREDERSLLEQLLWFGTGYATGDPLLWSPVTVELLLDDWFPRKIVAEPAYLAKLPNLARAFIRWAHEREGIRAALTDETLAAVDHYEPGYLRVIRSARLQGPAALLAGMFPSYDEDDEELDWGAIVLGDLERAVGGRFVLQNLDTEPLPDEPFEWAGIPDDVRPVVQEVLDWCDRCADEFFDVEHRTAMRRFLSRAASADPASFRRKASPVRGAAAVAWVIARANESAGPGAKLSVQELLAWFGVSGSASQRAEPLLRANGVNPHERYGTMNLGAPDLLTSTRRATIMTVRDRLTSG